MSARQDNELAHNVLRAIRRIVRRVSEHSKYLSREVGLTLPQLMCLKAVGELTVDGDEVTVAMVSERVQLSAATVSRVIERLVQAGLVLRERRAQDRRKVCLSLTDAGRGRFVVLPTPLQDRFVHRLLALDPAERQSLLGALERITELMDAENLDAAPMLAPGDDIKG